jgi:DNA-binding transcriptional LysR family regulator
MTRRATLASLNWNLLRAFSQVAQHRSFAEAARSAGVQRPTVSEKIARLEQQVGVGLIERRAGNEGFRLTHHGKQLRRLLLNFERQLTAWSTDAHERASRNDGQDILLEVEDALEALERVRRALRDR